MSSKLHRATSGMTHSDLAHAEASGCAAVDQDHGVAVPIMQGSERFYLAAQDTPAAAGSGFAEVRISQKDLLQCEQTRRSCHKPNAVKCSMLRLLSSYKHWLAGVLW